MKPRLSLFASLMLAYLMFSQQTTAQTNTPYGVGALSLNTTGTINTGIGCSALYSNRTSIYNTTQGFQALFSNTEAWFNTAIGTTALYSNTTGGIILPKGSKHFQIVRMIKKEHVASAMATYFKTFCSLAAYVVSLNATFYFLSTDATEPIQVMITALRHMKQKLW
jgi:hypothetical protein